MTSHGEGQTNKSAKSEIRAGNALRMTSRSEGKADKIAQAKRSGRGNQGRRKKKKGEEESPGHWAVLMWRALAEGDWEKVADGQRARTSDCSSRGTGHTSKTIFISVSLRDRPG